MITYRDVGMTYGDKTILKNINLTIEDGELFVLVGPSGSGKTTLLRMLNQLTVPTAGDVYLDDRKIKTYDVRQLRLHMGYVLQDSCLFPNLTVADNVTIQLEQQGVGKQQRRERAAELLTEVDLDPEQYADRYPHELSGGQQQRVALIRALATAPKLVLMDESFSALDPVLRQKAQELVLKLHQTYRPTIVFVTHDMQEALRMGHRIAVLHQGELQQVGTPNEILRHPANDFIRQFFGSRQPHWWQLAYLVQSGLLDQVTVTDQLPVLTQFSDLITRLQTVPQLAFQYQGQGYSVTREQLLTYLGQEGSGTDARTLAND
ncbi:ABC proline glycine betaine transporter ATPase [Levilactobacillus namurensis DSM 19117]|uniref:ABC-type quaternary amine transporter n=1 Tax=Levilactobacillus namurensis DSM 19117 TaxID=1423773 RepID=A0A0R1K8S6_9LACO|nr:ABC transporter ATP-binding protein [Levilactobacillus namurensis]KRK76290.1 ABC proline glycine betaine transporter ATPase [Levilactobacillus namurensis DSM 19117]GEO73689.1 ABC transporter ATPase [Levilactobacillus namurensis]HJE44378.1 ABC transporter ATP-binding protein [Levilactobacillus namurensis]